MSVSIYNRLQWRIKGGVYIQTAVADPGGGGGGHTFLGFQIAPPPSLESFPEATI